MSKNALILVAAGIGARALCENDENIPKQYRKIAGKTLLARTLDSLITAQVFDTLILVHAKDDPYIQDFMKNYQDASITLTHGGDSRTASVKAGMAALQAIAPDNVLIHDAARPFISKRVITDVLEGLKTYPSVVPALAVSDALKREDASAVDRTGLYRMQTPQGFHYAALMKAYSAQTPGQSFHDDIAVAQAAGLDVHFVTGDEDNFKVTYPQDFSKAERMIGSNFYTATGSGYDVHRYTDGDGIWLCGIKIEADYTLLGHSDADAGLHALTDAIFGALADGDIGDHFPPSDPQWKGASSDKFLKHAIDRLKARGGILQHVDVTLICEKPKVKPHREKMRERISQLCDLPLSRISVKATTTEKLGFTGREEGLAAQAVATVSLPDERA